MGKMWLEPARFYALGIKGFSAYRLKLEGLQEPKMLEARNYI